jgi:hypothetical protein
VSPLLPQRYMRERRAVGTNSKRTIMRRADFSSAALVLPVCTNSRAGGGQSCAHAGANAVSGKMWSSPAVAFLAILLAGVALLGCSDAPIGHALAQTEARPAAAAEARVSQAPAHIVASAGDDDYSEPLKYMGQPAVQ